MKAICKLQRSPGWRSATIFALLILILLVMVLYHKSVMNTATKQTQTQAEQATQLLIRPRQMDLESLEIIQSLTNIDLVNEIQKRWLKPPSNLPYNITPDMAFKDKDLSGTQKMHKVIVDLLKKKKNGFFIECGAYKGNALSNTLKLEQEYNWTGLLIEPDTKYYPALVQAQRKAWTINACLSVVPRKMKVEMMRHKTSGALSSLLSDSAPLKPNYQKFDAQCFPLASILGALGQLFNVDYLSLDIEGAELKVLKTIPWEYIFIKVISVEVSESTRTEITEFLSTKNYKRITFVGTMGSFIHDEVYAHNQYLEKMERTIESNTT